MLCVTFGFSVRLFILGGFAGLQYMSLVLCVLGSPHSFPVQGVLLYKLHHCLVVVFGFWLMCHCRIVVVDINFNFRLLHLWLLLVAGLADGVSIPLLSTSFIKVVVSFL